VANIFVAASATWNGKALKKAKQDVSVFDKQVKKLGTTLLGVFSARALFNYSKRAVAAFAADEKAAKSLEVQLKNTGFAFSSPAVELYIANLQRATGVLDDQLRPAFQQLLTVTGSITLSQNALNTALNVSAATGRSLTEVTAALAKGYAGNTTSLTRLGAGLSKATLKAGDMDAILTELNNKFAGQAQARLTTYAGKMDLLRVASENVKEEIGKGILGALDALGKDTNLDETTAKMEKLGKTTGQTITGLGVLLKTLSDIPGLGALGRAAYETSTFGLLARLARENQKGKFPTAPARETPAQGRILAAQRRQELKASQDLLKLKKQEVTTLKAKTAIDALKDKFDVERIGLTKALNEAQDEETKLRIKGQLAILDNNEALAKKILEELKAAEATKKLADAADKAAQSLGTFDPAKFRMGENKDLGMDAIQLLMALTAMQGAASGLVPLAGMGGKTKQAADTLAYGQKYTDLNEVLTGGSVFDPSFARRGESADLRITVDTAATGDRFAALIAESLQIAQKSGVSYGIAGGL
jgi:hypothetical protein